MCIHKQLSQLMDIKNFSYLATPHSILTWPSKLVSWLSSQPSTTTMHTTQMISKMLLVSKIWEDEHWYTWYLMEAQGICYTWRTKVHHALFGTNMITILDKGFSQGDIIHQMVSLGNCILSDYHYWKSFSISCQVLLSLMCQTPATHYKAMQQHP